MGADLGKCASIAGELLLLCGHDHRSTEAPKDDTPSPDEIIEVCRTTRAVPTNAANCNEFVIAITAKCGFALSGNADQIMREATSPPWRQLGHDGVKASAAAANGALVVGGMTSQALGDATGT